MKLPLELVEEIISYVPKTHIRLHCSRVAKSWSRLCQRRLFKTVDIHPRKLRSWLNKISPTNTELLGYVRTLTYVGYSLYSGTGEIEQPRIPLHDYFPSFRQLRSFNLSSIRVPLYSEKIELFSAFKYTLSTISLSGCCTTKNAFVTLINHFPNLAYLNLRDLDYHKEDEPATPLSRSLFKRLHVTEWSADSLDLLDELAKLGLHFEEVVLPSTFPRSTWTAFARRVVGAFGPSTKRLRLLETPRDTAFPSVLAHCQELCELEVFALSLDDAELNLLSSITSMSVEKIILTHSTAFRLPAGHAYWAQLDHILVQLVERSERGLRLEVEFRDVSVTWRGDADLGKCLPAFLRKGGMMVSNTKNEVVYRSD